MTDENPTHEVHEKRYSRNVTLQWTMPISLVITLISFAVMMAIGYEGIMQKLDNNLSKSEFRYWLNSEYESNPTIKWNVLPSDKSYEGKYDGENYQDSLVSTNNAAMATVIK